MIVRRPLRDIAVPGIERAGDGVLVSDVHGDADWKTGIDDVRLAITATGLRLEARIEAAKVEIIRWMIITIGSQALIILGAVIALARRMRQHLRSSVYTALGKKFGVRRASPSEAHDPEFYPRSGI